MVVVNLNGIGLFAAQSDDAFFGMSIVIGGLLVALGFLLFRLAGVRVSSLHTSEPYRVVNVGLLLRPGDRCSAMLADLLNGGDFSSVEWPALATERLAAVAASAEVVDGFFDIGNESWNARRTARQAQGLCESQAEIAGVEFAQGVPPDEPAPSPSSESATLLVVVASVRGFRGVARQPRLTQEVRAVMDALAELEGDEESWLGFWFTPLPGNPMALEECKVRFDAVLASTI